MLRHPPTSALVSLDISRSRGKTELDVKDNKYTVEIKIEAVGNITEAEGPIDVCDPQIKEELEKLMGEAISSEVRAAVAKAQELRCDPFGFGELLRRTSPKEWKKIKKQWREIIPEVEVKVEAKGIIQRKGMSGEPPFLDPWITRK